MALNDTVRRFRVRLEIGGVTLANFSEVTFGGPTPDVLASREVTDLSHVRKLAGLTKYGNISLKRGVTTSKELHNWRKAIIDGKTQQNRKDAAIVVQDERGADTARFTISKAWPMKYEPTTLNAQGNEVMIELLELANEGIERTQ